MAMYRNIPNIISIFRAILCIVMLVLPETVLETMGTTFIILYIVAFLSDIVDGNLARVTHTTSETGKKLDSFADLLFFILMVLKVLPWMFSQMEHWHCWVIVIGLAVVLISRFVSAMRCRKLTGSFTPIHSIPNKIVALLVFLIPFLFMWIGDISLLLVLVFALYAAADEIVKVKKYTDSYVNENCPPSD